jgi:hypothetical protein
MAQLTPLYIIASPHPRVGKTLIARLLIEFFRSDRRPIIAYDLNPHDPALAGYFPQLTWTVDITDIRGQMELFDQLIADDATARVIDLGYGPFNQFFAVMEEIGFVAEARRRSIEPIVLFIADRTPSTVHAYAALRERSPAIVFVPVHNEAVSVTFEQEDFPASRPECWMLRISRLSPIVRGVLDRPSFSFGAHLNDHAGSPTEIHSWIRGVFTAFRDLELRLMMGRFTSTLVGTSAHASEPRRTPRR